MKVLLITQARLGSSRLPGKVLKKISGVTLLEIHLKRLSRCEAVDKILVATTTQEVDQQIVSMARNFGCESFAGSETDVLDRYYQAAKPFQPEWIVRVTSDCPLIDPVLVDEVVRFSISHGVDYCSNTLGETFPDGQDIEVFKFESLAKAWNETKLPSDREHVTPYIRKNSSFFGQKMFSSSDYPSEKNYSGLRMTVDYPEDFELIKKLVDDLGINRSWLEYSDYIINKGLDRMNSSITRNDGYLKSISEDNSKMNRYSKSEEMLKRALKTVPLGSQTFSKSKTQLPHGVSPYFAKGGTGAILTDVDGNQYVDFNNSLASVTLGYNDPDVVKAVKQQLETGTIFSLANELEFIVAEKIVDMVPCAEMVRFGKNGSDATAGAIRVARAFTSKDHVLVCGYHGWQDWYIGSTARNLGVPEATRKLTHTFQYNDPESLVKLFNELKGNVAAVILEPVNVFAPKDNFLQKVKEITHANGAVLIFDETITGFRYANGGAQELFDVIPDLACFGKGLANGFPVSAVAGKAEIMKLMEEVFFSFTFGGELLSLAAANATLDKLKREPVIKQLQNTGEKVINGVRELIRKHAMGDIFSVEGYPVWSFFIIRDTEWCTSWEIKTLYLQEMFRNGIYTIGTHNISYAHTDAHVDSLLQAYDLFFKQMKLAIEKRDVRQFIHGKVLEPLFKLR